MNPGSPSIIPSSHEAALSSGSLSPATGRGRAVWRREVLPEQALRPGGLGRCLDRVHGRGPHTATQRT